MPGSFALVYLASRFMSVLKATRTAKVLMADPKHGRAAGSNATTTIYQAQKNDALRFDHARFAVSSENPARSKSEDAAVLTAVYSQFRIVRVTTFIAISAGPRTNHKILQH
ncbi:hypothetical protein BDR22DRAFT_894839 [Usnea florida]